MKTFTDHFPAAGSVGLSLCNDLSFIQTLHYFVCLQISVLHMCSCKKLIRALVVCVYTAEKSVFSERDLPEEPSFL